MTHPTRRHVLRASAALAASTAFASTATANPGRGDEHGNGRSFGAVYANGHLYRTNVVRVLDDEPHPSDALYFLTYDGAPVTASGMTTSDQLSPFVSEAAPGDQDWNGGKWVTYTANVTDLDAFNANGAHTSETDLLGNDYITVTKGNHLAMGPPDHFICPLNGRV